MINYKDNQCFYDINLLSFQGHHSLFFHTFINVTFNRLHILVVHIIVHASAISVLAMVWSK